MHFQRGKVREQPEINLIPMIDVLLVILIFLMITTTYTRFSALKIDLPEASGDTSNRKADQINISVDATEHYAVNGANFSYEGVDKLSAALRKAAGDVADPTIVINADAKAPHQAVINIMEAARLAGYGRITFTTSRK